MKKELTKEYFIEEFKKLGLQSGDFLLVHSAVEGISLAESMNCFNALLETVGPEGTVAFPTFNFAFCNGSTFDYKRTPSQMGMLTEMARRNPKASRILHPIYSFALFGKQAKELSEKINNISSFGDDSLFGEIRRQNAKILLIQLPFNKSMTFLHHIEEMVGVDYRFLKNFEGDIIDYKGNKKRAVYQMLVRNIEMGVETYVDEIQKRLEDLGLIKMSFIEDWPLRLMKAQEIFNAVSTIMKSEPHIMRKINKPKA
jgi:aminoglycoside 3-N-acetyltransferase